MRSEEQVTIAFAKIDVVAAELIDRQNQPGLRGLANDHRKVTVQACKRVGAELFVKIRRQVRGVFECRLFNRSVRTKGTGGGHKRGPENEDRRPSDSSLH